MKPKSKSKHLFNCAFDYELIFSSYHEAGHAICALFNYMDVNSVEIVVEGTVGGEMSVSWFYPEVNDNSELAYKLISAHLSSIAGGPAAERIFYCDASGASKVPPQLSFGAKRDVYEFRKIVKKYNLAQDKNTIKDVRSLVNRRVESVLRKYWHDVRSLAHALYKRKFLSKKHINGILLSGPNKQFWKSRLDHIEDIYRA